jgi:hypothetical protein
MLFRSSSIWCRPKRLMITRCQEGHTDILVAQMFHQETQCLIQFIYLRYLLAGKLPGSQRAARSKRVSSTTIYYLVQGMELWEEFHSRPREKPCDISGLLVTLLGRSRDQIYSAQFIEDCFNPLFNIGCNPNDIFTAISHKSLHYPWYSSAPINVLLIIESKLWISLL